MSPHPTSNRVFRTRGASAARAVGVSALLAASLGACGDRSRDARSASAPRTPAPDRATVLYRNVPPKVMQLAAGEGHVVVTRPTASGSDLIDVTTPGRPVTLASFDGMVAAPSIGTDRAGRPVAVLSPCLSRTDPAPRCSLVAIDLETRDRTPVPRSRFAYLGDLDAGRAVLVRTAGDRRTVRVALGRAAGSDDYEPVPIVVGMGSNRIESIDLAGSVIAAAVLFSDDEGSGGSSLLVHRPGAGQLWRRLAGSGYGLMNGDRREWRATTVTPTGIRAVYDGGANDDPYAARWDAAGRRAEKIRLPARFDIALSAFDGDELASVNNGDFGFDDEPNRYAVWRSGPYRLG